MFKKRARETGSRAVTRVETRVKSRKLFFVGKVPAGKPCQAHQSTAEQPQGPGCAGGPALYEGRSQQHQGQKKYESFRGP